MASKDVTFFPADFESGRLSRICSFERLMERGSIVVPKQTVSIKDPQKDTSKKPLKPF